jgi:hypothetical protein
LPDDEFGDTSGIGKRRIKDRNAPNQCGIEVNLISANTKAAHRE